METFSSHGGYFTQLIGASTEVPISIESNGSKPSDSTYDSRSNEYDAYDPREYVLSYMERYDNLTMLGRGGMGEVYAAKDKILKRIVAIKTTIKEHHDRYLNYRLKREAQLLAQLEHPNIIPVYDLGELPDTRFYFSMPLLKGVVLSSLLRKFDALDIEAELPRFLDIYTKVCEAVSYAHRRGIVHRDIKPSNIFLGNDGIVFLIDWGLAIKIKSPEKEDGAEVLLTDDEQPRGFNFSGTLVYMAPEQVIGDRYNVIDEQSDIFQLGGLLLSLMTGRPTHQLKHGSLRESIEEISNLSYVTNIDLIPTWIPEDLKNICIKCLSINKSGRYKTVRDLLRDLRKFRGSSNTPLDKYAFASMILGCCTASASALCLLNTITGFYTIHWSFWGSILSVSLGLSISKFMELYFSDRGASDE